MKIFNLLTFIIIILIIIVGVSIAIWKIDEERCYNMPLNSFYKDNWCIRHTWTYNEMNNK